MYPARFKNVIYHLIYSTGQASRTIDWHNVNILMIDEIITFLWIKFIDKNVSERVLKDWIILYIITKNNLFFAKYITKINPTAKVVGGRKWFSIRIFIKNLIFNLYILFYVPRSSYKFRYFLNPKKSSNPISKQKHKTQNTYPIC